MERMQDKIGNEAIRKNAIHRVSTKRQKPVPYIAAGSGETTRLEMILAVQIIYQS